MDGDRLTGEMEAQGEDNCSVRISVFGQLESRRERETVIDHGGCANYNGERIHETNPRI